MFFFLLLSYRCWESFPTLVRSILPRTSWPLSAHFWTGTLKVSTMIVVLFCPSLVLVWSCETLVLSSLLKIITLWILLLSLLLLPEVSIILHGSHIEML